MENKDEIKTYKTWQEAFDDGWHLIPMIFRTKYNYFIRNGEMKREDRLIVK